MAAIEIGTIQELIAFGNGDYGHGSSSDYLNVELTADLDFADLSQNNVAYNWGGCVGDWYIFFDGKSHKIDNISYSGSASWYFFQNLKANSTVKNVKLTNARVVTSGQAATFADIGKEVDNVHVSGAFTAYDICCGIGYRFATSGGVLKNSGFSGMLISTNNICAGLVYAGGAYHPSMYTCYVYADLKSGGGYLFGFTNTNCIVFDSWIRGTFQNNNNNTYLFDSSQNTEIGCYGAITASDRVVNAPPQINSFYDSDLASAGGYSVSGGLAGATTAQLKDADWLYEHGFPS